MDQSIGALVVVAFGLLDPSWAACTDDGVAMLLILTLVVMVRTKFDVITVETMVQGQNMYLNVRIALFGALAVVCILATGHARDAVAQDSTQDIRVSGYAEFVHSCAACHGLDGAGNGPLAPALKAVPPDLTELSSRNNGTFPFLLVRELIANGGGIRSHGEGEMPIWRERFRSYLSPELTEELIDNLTRHLESIQR